MNNPWSSRVPSLRAGAAVLLAFASGSAIYAQSYAAVDIDPAQSEVLATGINNSGTVVGYSNNADSGTAGAGGFVFENGAIITMPGADGGSGDALGINNAGEVVGQFGGEYAVEYVNYVTPLDVGVIVGGPSVAYAINDAGIIVGASVNVRSLTKQAFLCNDSIIVQPVSLGTLGGHMSAAYAINLAGTVAGISNTTGDNAQHAFSYSNGAMTDLGTLGGGTSGAYGINSAGTIVGFATTAGDATQHAFSYANGVMTDLGTLGGATATATAINASGTVVGYSTTSGGAQHAFVCSNGVMADLNNEVNLPGVTLTAATGVNDTGFITANGSNGHAYLLANTPNQIVVFAALPGHTYGDAPFALNATSSSGLAIVYSVSGPAIINGNTVTLTGAGTVTIRASQPGNATFSAAPSVTRSFVVAKATPVVTWPTPAAIIYGTPLSGAQLDASANVRGTFSYNPAAGSVLGAGNQALYATFTPTDSADYVATNPFTPISVNRATPAVIWNAPAAIIYGTSLSGAQLDAYATVPGSYSYSPSAGTVLPVGNQPLTLTFTPADTVDYGAATLSVTLAVNPAGGSYPYAAVDVGILNGTDSIGYALNNAGEIVGASETYAATSWYFLNGFTYINGVLANIGFPLGIQPNTSPSGASAYGVNDAGTVVGVTSINGFNYQHAFSYGNGVMTDLGTLGGQSSAASGINNAGTVVGNAQIANGLMHAFRYSGGAMTDLGILGGSPSTGMSSTANAINGAGTVVGISSTSTGDQHAFQYKGGVMTDLGDLGTFENTSYSDATAINSAGTIVGISIASRSTAYAFSYSNGVMSNLGSLYNYSQSGSGGTSEATGINDAGTVVGYSTADAQGDQDAFVFSNGVMTDLNTLVSPSGIVFTSAFGINNQGQIGVIGGNEHTYLLTPVGSLSSQTLSFGAEPNHTYGDAPFTLGGTSTSGLTPVYTVVGGLATISGSTVTITGTGTVTIQASQPGDGSYSAAPLVTQTFTVSKASATVALGNLIQYGDGSSETAAVTTVPANLAVLSTYNGVPLATGVPTGGALVAYNSMIGQTLYLSATGSTTGTVYGSGTYGIDSDVRTAAVHAGVLTAGQTAILQIKILADQGSYAGSTANGVTSRSGGYCGGSFQVLGIATTGFTTGPIAPGTYALAAAVMDPNYAGSTSGTLTIVTPAPTFTLAASPSAATVATGRTVVFNAIATGASASTYQWTLNGSSIIPGASVTTDPILVISGTTSVDAGTITCTANNSYGAATSSAALAVTAPSSPGYLTNLSGRGVVGSGAVNALFGGFGIAGTGSKDLLIRGMGPSLVQVNIPAGTELASTQLALYYSGSVIAQNSPWGGSAAIVNAENAVGAYLVPANSLDSMLYLPEPPATYSAEVGGVNGDTGIAMIELYDVDTPPLSSRLVNLSVRAPVGTGNNILFGGFSIGGSTDEAILIRAIGPSLAGPPSNITTGFLAQPVLTLYQGNTLLYTNTVWSGDPALINAENVVGAYPIAISSQDSLLLVSLPNGNYTTEITGVNYTTGIAVVEIYEVY